MDDYKYIINIEIETNNKVEQKTIIIEEENQLTDYSLKQIISFKLEKGVFRFKILDKEVFYKGKKI